MSKTYFTSDTHFGHKNIIAHSHRPFKTTEEMGAVLIENWNAVVNPTDTVYHLGDFALCNSKRATEILHSLHGEIHLILGNHDSWLKGQRRRDLFASVSQLKRVTVEDQIVVLCHYAMRVWERSHKGVWQLYGHSHGSLPDDPNALSLDVGVDTELAGYAPVSMDQLREAMARKEWQPVDHHQERE